MEHQALERRTLLGVAGVAGLGAIASMATAAGGGAGGGGGGGGGGPINPPAGAVGSTGRTLDEIYNRVPAGGAGDGRTAIPGGTAQVTLSQPGSYVLTGNLSVAGTAIVISAANVTLDLGGFTVTNTLTTSSVVSIAAAAQRAVVRNGRVIGGGLGVSAATGARGVVLEDLLVSGPRTTGVSLNGSDGGVVRRCHVTDVGLTTTAAEAGSAIGITVAGLGALIDSCTVTNVIHNNPGALTRGYSVSPNVSIQGCVAVNDAANPGTTGVFCSSLSSFRRNCRVLNFATAYSSGTDGGGNF